MLFEIIYQWTFSVNHVKNIKLFGKVYFFEAKKFDNDNLNVARKDR